MAIRLLFLVSFLSTPLSILAKESELGSRQKQFLLYFRWDKDELHRDYMENESALKEIERIFSHSIILSKMDSVVIKAFASPEGDFGYNQRLSERRVRTMTTFLQGKYPLLQEHKIKGYGKGEDWDGFRRMVQADSLVPNKDALLLLIDSSLSPDEKEQRIRQMNGGEVYRYIDRHILPYLRTGATFVLFYPKELEPLVNGEEGRSLTLMDPEAISFLPLAPIVSPMTIESEIKPYTERFIRPVAFKTNLLFDAATLFNVELEVPIGKHFSVLGEWIFPFWGGLGNRGGVSPFPIYSEDFTMQMLSAGLEGRYWFKRNEKLNDKAQRWGDFNPLNGWFVGIYTQAGIYDFQFNKKGMQGDFYVAAGVSGGYAHPIGKQFHMEYSLGVGYLSTQYYNYSAMDGHKVVNVLPNGQYDRRKQTWIGPTKVKVSLVWTPRFKIKSKRPDR